MLEETRSRRKPRERREHLRVDDKAPRHEAPRRTEAVRPDAGLRLERGTDGQLWALCDGQEQAVKVTRCFPWTEPSRFVSLRSDEDDEVALIRDTTELDDASRAALEHSLVEAGFVLEVEAIENVDEEIEIRTWKVLTRQGPRSFQTPRDEWPRQVPGGGLIIRDVAGDLFYIARPDRLDKKSQRWLWPFVD